MKVNVRMIESDQRYLDAEAKIERIQKEIQKTNNEIGTVNRKRQTDLEARVAARLAGEKVKPAYDAEGELEELRGVLDILGGKLREAEAERDGVVAVIKSEIASDLKAQYGKCVLEHVKDSFAYMRSMQTMLAVTDQINRAGVGLSMEPLVMMGEPVKFSLRTDSVFWNYLVTTLPRYLSLEESARLLHEQGAALDQVRSFVLQWHHNYRTGVLSVTHDEVRAMLA